MTKNKFMVVLMATALMATTACRTTENYDPENYEGIMSEAFPVNNVDKSHNWVTFSECTANIEVNMENGKSYMVKVYENDPTANNTGTVMVQGMVESGSALKANFSYPQTATTFYVAIVDNGTTYLQSVTVKNGMVSANITPASLQSMKSTTATIADEGFDMAYCFEDCFPEPGDFDYNDAVLGVKMKKTVNAKQTKIELEPSIRAVGSNKLMAAALHIAGLKEDDIESVEWNGALFTYYAYGMGNFYDEDKNLMFPQKQPEKGYEVTRYQNDDIYIPLTNDLHYAISGEKTNNFGMVDRINYNTMLESQKPEPTEGGEVIVIADDVPAVTGNVVITLKEGVGDKNITFKDLDMFIIEEYNGIIWEIHTYIYKKKLVAFPDGYYEDNIYPWALAVPGKGFRWPAEGMEIGTYKTSSVLGGAYQDINHSFGQWASDRTIARDWYKYPTMIMVYN
ncbi:MAG: LruC domain-containing protein [Prevotella sp.]|nr:LruC domain-containing protein [Prevotella sp.]